MMILSIIVGYVYAQLAEWNQENPFEIYICFAQNHKIHANIPKLEKVHYAVLQHQMFAPNLFNKN